MRPDGSAAESAEARPAPPCGCPPSGTRGRPHSRRAAPHVFRGLVWLRRFSRPRAGRESRPSAGGARTDSAPPPQASRGRGLSAAGTRPLHLQPPSPHACRCAPTASPTASAPCGLPEALAAPRRGRGDPPSRPDVCADHSCGPDVAPNLSLRRSPDALRLLRARSGGRGAGLAAQSRLRRAHATLSVRPAQRAGVRGPLVLFAKPQNLRSLSARPSRLPPHHRARPPGLPERALRPRQQGLRRLFRVCVRVRAWEGHRIPPPPPVNWPLRGSSGRAALERR